MASTKDAQIGEGASDDKTLMLKQALKCINGTIDFDKLASKLGVSTGSAMKKRFKRYFEKDEEDPIQLKGSILGGAEDGTSVPKPPRTPKPKVVKPAANGDDDTATPKTKPAAKRKAVEVSKDDDEVKDGVTDDNNTAVTDAVTAPEEDGAADGSPKKKARKTPAKSRKPATPKAAKLPATPKASKTPKSAAKVQNSDDEADANEDEDAKTDGVTIGSAAVQAKTDAQAKANEEANGSAMGEPAKQAKHDAIEASMKDGADY